jgi:hypothetical protein
VGKEGAPRGRALWSCWREGIAAIDTLSLFVRLNILKVLEDNHMVQARWQAEAVGSMRWRTQCIYRWRMTMDGEYHHGEINLDFPRVSMAVARFLREC